MWFICTFVWSIIRLNHCRARRSAQNLAREIRARRQRASDDTFPVCCTLAESFLTANRRFRTRFQPVGLAPAYCVIEADTRFVSRGLLHRQESHIVHGIKRGKRLSLLVWSWPPRAIAEHHADLTLGFAKLPRACRAKQ